MTVVVSGASGHVGGNLIRELLRQGRRVRAIVREDIRAVDGLDLELVRADVLDRQSLDAALVGAEVVYHLAARISVIGDPDGSVYRTNVLGTRNMVSAALEAGVSRFVHFSSIHAFSRYPKQGMIDESRPLTEGKDVPAYDKTKAQGEREVARGVADGLDAVIINPTAVIGPHDYKPSHMGQFFLHVLSRAASRAVARRIRLGGRSRRGPRGADRGKGRENRGKIHPLRTMAHGGAFGKIG